MEKIIILLMFVNITFCQSQQLTINETLNYINSTLKNDPIGKTYNIELSTDGLININQYYTGSCTMHYSEVTLSKLSFDNKHQTRFWCKTTDNVFNKSNCITCDKKKATHFLDISIINKYESEKFFNALKYLFSLIQQSGAFERNDDDPFAPKNFNKNSTSITGNLSSDKIKLKKFGGVYKVLVNIGGVKKYFILDSGASNISISKKTERELINKNIIKKKDYLEPALYRLADGSIIKCRRLVLSSIKIGDYTIKNIIASVGVSNAPLLLGQSFLNKFKKWSINNSTNELILER